MILLGILYDVVDKMEMDYTDFEIERDVLELMEEYPLVEFGSPVPLTHFIESFYKEYKDQYEKQLKESLERNPTVHTVWLLNRVINGEQDEKKLELMRILNSICKNDKIHKKIRNVAGNFLKSHLD